ncbi:MAG: FAD-dependent monooxygenase, partial [Armatimonadota bacterium]
MKVVIIGAGPAGLYCGLLMKKANPAHDITIHERNPRDATYGWGVVFSERTLGAFQDADAKTARAITDRFVIWDAIDIHYRGKRLHCGGQVFSGISRKALLGVLQRRCEELGVTLRFHSEIADLSAFAGADVIIAADGVNSVVRKMHTRVFRPSLEEGQCKYIWLGTHWWLEAFTFIFRETEHGL